MTGTRALAVTGRALLPAALSLCAVLLCLSPVPAAATPATSAELAPARDMLATWTLTLPNEQWVRHTSRPGDRIVIEDADLGIRWALVTRLEMPGQVLLVDIHDLAATDGTQAGPILETVRLEPGTARQVYVARGLDLRFETSAAPLALRSCSNSAAGEAAPLTSRALGDPIPAGCCVTCGSTSACGCSVEMSCGNCCMPACCPPEY